MAITNASKLASYVGAAITADGASGIVTAKQFVGDFTTATGIGVTSDINTSSLVVAGISTLGNVTAGVATANQFSGNITGTAATFSGNVTIGGVLTYDDVTNVDSIGLVTARNGLQVLAGITTLVGQTVLSNTNVTSGILTVGGQTNLTNVNVSAGSTFATLTVSGQSTLANVNIATGVATVAGQTSLANVSVSAASTFSGKINANSGVGFTGFLREGINIVSGKLSDNTTINIDHSMAHYFTTTETTTGIPNFTSTAGINTDLSVGETFSVNVITTAAAAGYSTGARIDAGSTLSVLWNGGSDPSAGGDGGVDAYTYQVIKTGDAAFTILGNVSNFA
jgi:hypothetical protein